MPSTAVVILNWNGQKLLEQFLPNVVKNSSLPNVEVIVADNASSDNSISFVEQNFPSVGIIKLDKNYGFADGYNRALETIDADYFVLLNSDATPEPNWLPPLIEAMDKDNNLAACMPKIRAFKEPNKFEHAGACGGYIDIFGYPFCRGRILDRVEEDKGQYQQPISIFWATGAALMIRKELYEKAGGLDKTFFAHMEEIDMCWQIKNMGYKIMCIPQSEVLHVGAATLNQYSTKKTYLNFRNNLIMLVKNLSTHRLLPILFIRLILDGVAGLHFISKGQINHCWAIIKAHFSFYGELPNTIKKRRKLASIRKKTLHNEIYPKSIIWNFYILKIRTFSALKHFKL